MSTLLELVQAGLLVKLDPQLPAMVMEDRRIFVVPRVAKWIVEDLPGLHATWKTEITPDQQFDEYVATFCAGEALVLGPHFKKLRHVDDGIWTLKTPDLRVFGWFYAKDTYVASGAREAGLVKRYELYEGLRQEALHTRNMLELDPPKFINGDNPNAVVTNYSFP